MASGLLIGAGAGLGALFAGQHIVPRIVESIEEGGILNKRTRKAIGSANIQRAEAAWKINEDRNKEASGLLSTILQDL